MSEKTAPALARIEHLLALVRAFPASAAATQLLEEAEALQRAIGAFHLEAIRFRMYSVDRLLHQSGDDAAAREAFAALRQALEAAGFHTRSHSAP